MPHKRKQKLATVSVIDCSFSKIIEVSKNLYKNLLNIRKGVFADTPSLHSIFVPKVIGKSFNDLKNKKKTDVIVDSSVYKNIDLTAGFVFVDKINFSKIINCKDKVLRINYIFNGKKYTSYLKRQFLFYKGIGSHLETLQNSLYLKEQIIESIPDSAYVLLTIETPSVNKAKPRVNKISCSLSFDLSLPGGGKKYNETDRHCICREFVEETGFELQKNAHITIIKDSIQYSFMGKETRAWSRYAVVKLKSSTLVDRNQIGGN